MCPEERQPHRLDRPERVLQPGLQFDVERDEALTAPVIVWFRDDLRLADHPALAAAADGRPVLCVFVRDEQSTGLRRLGGAARWWLGQSLRALDRDLRTIGGRLVLRSGAAAEVVPAIAAETGAAAVHWNRRHDPGAMAIDADVAQRLATQGVEVRTFPQRLLHEPDRLRTKSGTPFSVFTPFWRRLLELTPPAPLPAPPRLVAPPPCRCDAIETWSLEPRSPDWAGGLRATWIAGEAAARDRIAQFIDEKLAGYASRRDLPGRDGTSLLSPHLRFGEISAVQVRHAILLASERMRDASSADTDKFMAEIGWREFCHHLLHHRGDLHRRNIQARFDAFPWRDDAAALKAWQHGCTGYPLVDAGMRQLWTTGWMHNRVRMVAASFLVKHLMLDWRLGEAWFWDTLVDADVANNPAGWQWVAGSGADAAPFFRIFNPVTQSQKFDPDGAYIRHWVPELAGLSDRDVHAPWAAASTTKTSDARAYPDPIVDHAAARTRALAAFSHLGKVGSEY
jgi:deoxyribodipyrimidine photo-lyase